MFLLLIPNIKNTFNFLINTEASVCTSALVLFYKVWGIFWHLSLSVGSHEGCHVSSVGFGLRCCVFT